MGYVLCAGTQLKHRKNLGEGIDRQPEPENLVGTAEPSAQFIQLQMRVCWLLLTSVQEMGLFCTMERAGLPQPY